MVWTHNYIQVRQHSSCPSKDPYLSHLAPPLPVLFSSSFQFEIHITGMCNTAADALSHNDTKLFYEILPYGSAPVALRASLQPRAQLDISTLENTIQKVFIEGIASRTRSTYSTAQQHYAKSQHQPSFSNRALSMSAYLANEGLCTQSITCAIYKSQQGYQLHPVAMAPVHTQRY